MLGEAGWTNLGPFCWGGAQPQSWAPPQGLRQLPSPGGQAGWKGDGSVLRSFLGVQKSPVRVPTLAFSEAQTLVTDPLGLPAGRGGDSGLLRSSSAARGAGAGRRRSWVLSGAPGELEHAPGSAPRRGRAHGGSGLARAARGPRLTSQDSGPARRSAVGAPALGAPAPAAQLLRMTSSHLPPPGPHLPATGGAASGRPRGRWEM